jgi:DHA1 family multidrug resistance protein-like MFS transporter
MQEPSRRNLLLISFSQFGATFSFNFVGVFLPFLIFKISPYSYQQTLLWVGVIIGSTGVFTALTSTFWGSLTHRFSPKKLYLRGLLIHLVMFLLMGFTTNLYLLLILRIGQGFVGGVSTIGLIIVSSSSRKEKIQADIGIFQSAMTLGQLVGPPLGSLAAALFGFRGAFLSASAVLLASFLFCYHYVTDVPLLTEVKSFDHPRLNKQILIGWMLCFTAQTQLTFLPSVLPKVFERMTIEQSLALKLAGLVVMLYTATAMVGTYVWSWLSGRWGIYKTVAYLCVGGILFQSLLALSRGILDFTIIRMAQTGLVAAAIPLIISMFLSDPRGSTVGFLNSARFAGNALGPMIATSVLAFSNLATLYLFISGISLVALLSFRRTFKD